MNETRNDYDWMNVWMDDSMCYVCEVIFGCIFLEQKYVDGIRYEYDEWMTMCEWGE